MCREARTDAERFWSLPFDRLRCKVGESFQNLKAPFIVAPATRASIEAALDDLLAMILIRHGAWDEVGAGEARVELAPRAYSVDPDATSISARIVRTAQAVDPWLDAGLLRSWLTPPGRGSLMVDELGLALRKAAREQRTPEWKEPTLYLSLLIAVRAILDAWTLQQGVLSGNDIGPRVELAVASLLHVTLEELLRPCFAAPSSTRSMLIGLGDVCMLETAASPLSFLAEPDSVFLSDANPYGFTFELYFAANFLWKKDGPGADAEMDVDRANAQVAKEASRVKEAVESRWLNELRQHVVSVLSDEKDLETELGRELSRLVYDGKHLRSTAFSPTANGKVRRLLQRLTSSGREGQRFEELADHFGAAERLKDDPSGAFGRDIDPLQLLREAVRAVRVFALDKWSREHVAKSASLLVERRPESDGKERINSDYESGRLYRLAGDDHPLVQPQRTGEQGQLFVDLKDFTKQTHALKEGNMADFLRAEFYGPMLSIAGELVSDGGLAAIELNNVLGDAMSFGGDVVALLDLAERAQEHLGSYREKIRERVGEEEIRVEMERIEKSYVAEKRRLAEQRTLLQAILRDLKTRLLRAQELGGATADRGVDLLMEANRVENALYELDNRGNVLESETGWQEEFLAARELVAGVFIAFGAPAVEVRVSDPAFGDVKVAIAEKINEAARGTGRSPEVRRRIDLLVKSARERRGERGLEYPFRVHIERVAHVPVPPGLLDESQKLLSKMKDAELRILFEKMTTTHELYNAGIALSGEALLAYRRLTGSRFHFFAKSFDILELEDDINARFAFGAQRIRLVFAAVSGSDRPRHVFRFAGSLVFRGFERHTPTEVYELLNPGDAFHRMLVRKCFVRWYKSFQDGQGADGIEPFP